MSKRVSIPKLGMKRSKPPSFSDFTLARQSLDESTMITACSLLLSERDYQDGFEGESDYSKLLSIYRKCSDASAIVEQHVSAIPQSVPSLPAPPSNMALTPSARAATSRVGKKSQGQINSMSPPKRMSLAQMARSTAVGRNTGVAAGSRRPVLKRVPSDSSIASVNSTGSRGSSNKKARISHTLGATGSNSASEGKKAAAPPAAVRNFLQALNNQKQRHQKPKERDDFVDQAGKNSTQTKRISPRSRNG